LLIEPNRSPHHPRLFSEFTRCLPATDRRWLIENLYQPHRETVSSAVREGLQDGPGHVVHVGFHTFTPTLDGQLRNADVAWLYDPSRPAERAWCDRWREALAARRPDLRLRRNYPYRGQSDGLTSSLRAAFGRRYLGIELEVNQTWPLDHPARWQPLQRDLIESMPRPTAP
jgi:predicted N-formylglutamate amidohydrolase